MIRSVVPLAHSIYSLAKTALDEPVFIIHGLLGCKLNWRSIAKSLNRRHIDNVICVDARNHGDSPWSKDCSYASMADDVVNMIAKLNASRAALIGHSMGGKIAMVAALHQPFLISRIVIVDIAPIDSANACNLEHYISIMRSVDLEKSLDDVGGSISVLRQKLHRDWESKLESANMRSFLLTNLTEKNGKVFWKVNLDDVERNLKELCTFPYTSNDSISYNRPSLFIAGANSPFHRPESMREVLHFFPKASRIEIPNAGHWVNADAPEPLCDTIATFLKSEID